MQRVVSKKHVRGVVSATFIGATGLVAVLGWPREHLLTEMGQPLLKIKPEQVNISDPEDEETYWLSDHQLLVVTPDPKNSAARFEHSIYGVPPYETWQGSADLFDTVTHKRSRLKELTQRIERTTERPEWRPDSFKISPDHLWIQWQTYNGSDGWPIPHAAHLDGTHYRTWFRAKRGQENFFLDSQHLCQIEAEDTPAMKVLDLEDPKKDRPCTTPEQVNAALSEYAARLPIYLDVPAFDAGEDVGRVQVDTYRMQDRLTLRLARWADKSKEPQPIQSRTVTLPPSATLRDGGIAPTQQALFFHVRRAHISSLLNWRHRLFPKFITKPELSEELWVSRPEGGGMRKVGHLPIHRDSNGNIRDQLSHIEWLPDGKQISFRYHDMFYVVPAAPGN